MNPGAAVRTLDPSEAMFAGNRSTVAYSAFGAGVLDIDALTLAFRALLRSYPVLATQIVSAGHEYVLHHVPHPPALQVGTCTALPPAGFTIVDPDAVCAIDVAQQGNDFRLTLLTHHSIADAGASLKYLEVLCSLYTRVVETGSAGATRRHPLAMSLEQFLAERGYVIPAPCAPPATPVEPTVETAVVLRHGRTRLSRAQTTRLFDSARAAGLTVHGIVCAAILSAAQALSRSQDPVTFGLTSSVDLRTRTGAPITAVQGTVIQGADTATLAVTSDDEPLRLARGTGLPGQRPRGSPCAPSIPTASTAAAAVRRESAHGHELGPHTCAAPAGGAAHTRLPCHRTWVAHPVAGHDTSPELLRHHLRGTTQPRSPGLGSR